jgi:hypothetical protein
MRAATPTRAARSSGFRSLPLPGAVRLRRVDRICEEIGSAGCVAEGKRASSSFVDMMGLKLVAIKIELQARTGASL